MKAAETQNAVTKKKEPEEGISRKDGIKSIPESPFKKTSARIKGSISEIIVKEEESEDCAADIDKLIGSEEAGKEWIEVPGLREAGFYEQATSYFNSFFEDFLYSGKKEAEAKYENEKENEERKVFADDEVITYREKKEFIRKMMLNSLLRGPHNNITYDEKLKYETWKIISKFNEQLSFLHYDSVL